MYLAEHTAQRIRAAVALAGMIALTAALNGQSPARATTGLTAVEGIKVGHFTLTERPTGCTAILVDGDAVGGVSQRGGAPGTRETDLLNPLNMVDKVNAVVLAGGSAFGLDAATGVVRWLEEHDIGWPAGPARVPIVPAAILFDLGVGNPRVRRRPTVATKPRRRPPQAQFKRAPSAQAPAQRSASSADPPAPRSRGSARLRSHCPAGSSSPPSSP